MFFVVLDEVMPVWLLVLIIVGSLILLIGVYFLLHFTFFAHRKTKKQIREYVRIFEHNHALIFGQDLQYVKRLEMIATINLLYVDIHLRFSKRYREIKDVDDASMSNRINKMKDLLNDRNWKALKTYLPDLKRRLDDYEQKVSSLNTDLLTVIRPEEECRENSLRLKDRYRQLKSEYYSKQSELSLVAGTLEKVFAGIEKDFAVFEDLVAGAKYQEAEAMLPKLSSVITELEKAYKLLPNICLSVQTVIPDKLASLEHNYDELVRQGYPLSHIASSYDFSSIRKQLSSLKERVKMFEIRDVQNEFDGILARIEEYASQFENEQNAKREFEENVAEVYRLDNGLEKRFIRLSNALPSVRKIYQISQEQQNKIDSLKSEINQLGAIKRNLDSLIHSPSKQPYSLLLEKMNKLKDEAIQVKTSLDDFEEYLQSLKRDAEEGIAFIKEFYEKLVEAEKKIRDIDLESVDNKYRPRIAEQFDNLDLANRELHQTPIDVAEVNRKIAAMAGSGGELLSRIDADYRNMLYSEASIVYANRKRNHFGEMDSILSQAEGLFYSGEFEKAYAETIDELKRRQDS